MSEPDLPTRPTSHSITLEDLRASYARSQDSIPQNLYIDSSDAEEELDDDEEVESPELDEQFILLLNGDAHDSLDVGDSQEVGDLQDIDESQEVADSTLYPKSGADSEEKIDHGEEGEKLFEKLKESRPDAAKEDFFKPSIGWDLQAMENAIQNAFGAKLYNPRRIMTVPNINSERHPLPETSLPVDATKLPPDLMKIEQDIERISMSGRPVSNLPPTFVDSDSEQHEPPTYTNHPSQEPEIHHKIVSEERNFSFSNSESVSLGYLGKNVLADDSDSDAKPSPKLPQRPIKSRPRVSTEANDPLSILKRKLEARHGEQKLNSTYLNVEKSTPERPKTMPRPTSPASPKPQKSKSLFLNRSNTTPQVPVDKSIFGRRNRRMPPDLKLEGWMYKKNPGGPKGMKLWKKRYVISRDDEILYFKSRRDKDPVGQIPYSVIKRVVYARDKKPRGCRFDIFTTLPSGRTYQFMSPEACLCTRYVERLSTVSEYFADGGGKIVH